MIAEDFDGNILETEVMYAINSLKFNKGVGLDKMPNEIFKHGKNVIVPWLTKLYNYIFNNCIYPANWSYHVIIPIFKKGDPSDPNNYRGITLTSPMTKVFSIILNNRIVNWADSNDTLCDAQNGIRNGRSTIDCVFVLQSLISKCINSKKRLFCAFIDFKKAFDYVYRCGLWHKLLNEGISSKMVNVLKEMYASVKACVKMNGTKSDFFDLNSGVRQGEPLSPMLFLLFINDVQQYLSQDEHFSIELFLLLFADDTVLLADTPEK